MSSYRLRPKAAQDLEAIGDFIAADNPKRAVSFIDELLILCTRIVERRLIRAGRTLLLASGKPFTAGTSSSSRSSLTLS